MIVRERRRGGDRGFAVMVNGEVAIAGRVRLCSSFERKTTRCPPSAMGHVGAKCADTHMTQQHHADALTRFRSRAMRTEAP